MSDKLGPYIKKLMTTILDKEQEEFVRELALSELSRLHIDINSFIKKYLNSQEKENLEKEKQTEKQLLQEEK